MEQTSDFHAASLTWLLEAPAPDAPDSAELVFLFQPVTHWTVTFVLGWTCRPAGCQKSFSSDSDEPMLSPHLAWQQLLHLLGFPRFKT